MPNQFYYLIWVDLSSRRTYVYEGSRLVMSFSELMGGQPGHPTSTGNFTVYSCEAMHHSRRYNADMPYSVFYHDGEAFHAGSISSRSHGCIHMREGAARRLYNWALPIWTASQRSGSNFIHVHIQQ